MAERYLPYDESLPVDLLAGIFKDKSESYKLFWFKAVVDAVCEGETVIPYDDLLNRMIADAWYMVMEFHLNLGPKDAIEIMIKELSKSSNLKSTEKKEKIIAFLKENSDAGIRKAKSKLVKNVPYRLQAPFLGRLTEEQWRSFDYVSNLAAQKDRVLYYYERVNGSVKRIRINEPWACYIGKNQAILRGWIENEMIQYLQRRNPNVPGIPFKLSPPVKRDLRTAWLFWREAIRNFTICDIYTGKILNSRNEEWMGKIAIDHFIPWSYVANDEMWNLTPTFAAVNRNKSNFLPGREEDVKKLAKQHYRAFRISQENKEMEKLFNAFKEKHLNSPEAESKLYCRETDGEEFEKNMLSLINPLYCSASNMGFLDWTLRNYEQQVYLR